MRTNQKKGTYVLLALIVILGSALRLYGLSDKSLWLDEIGSVVNWAQRDVSYILSHAFESRARVAPLYFIILHFFLPFGRDEFILRLPSVIFGILSILLIYKVGELLFGPKEGLISAFLLSISTMHIRYSQEARMYSLAMLLSLSSLFLFYKATKEGDEKLWIGSILLAILGVLSHYYMLFVPLIEMLFFVFVLTKNRRSFILRVRKFGKKKLSMLILGLIIISICLLPLFQKVLDLINIGVAFRVPWGLKPTSFFEELFSDFSTGDHVTKGMKASILYLFLLTFLLGLFASIKEFREQTVLLLSWVFLPIMVVAILTFSFGEPITTAKYMIFILPGYLIAISRGTSSIASALIKSYYKLYYKITYGLSSFHLVKGKQEAITAAIVIVIMMTFAGLGTIPLQGYYSWEKENWRAAAEYLEANSRSGDIIVVEPNYTLRCLLYYYEASSKKIIALSANGSLVNIEDISLEHDSVWFVLNVGRVEENIREWLRRNFMEARRFTGIIIYSSMRPNGLILVVTKDMHFVGLDSPPDQSEAKFLHNNDSATFNVTISNAANYTIAIHAESIIRSALELEIDGVSKGIKTFTADDWSYVELATLYLDSGSHEIKLINREGGDLGNTNVIFDQVGIWVKQ